MTMYEDGDLDLNPKFQRFYRWKEPQKTKLIESILLGIPIPSIFVSQTKEGKWEVIDGLQRLSSVLEFFGVLEKPDNTVMDPLVLGTGGIVAELDGASYEETDIEGSFVISDTLKRILKRSKLNVTIILRESDLTAKYEMFSRINSGGLSLSEQETRSCIMVMIDEETYDRLESVVTDYDLVNIFGLTDRAESQRYDMELLCRWLSFHDDELLNFRINQIRYDVSDFVTRRIINFLQLDIEAKQNTMKRLEHSFKHLQELDGELPFGLPGRRGLQLGAYEALFIGLTFNESKFLSLTQVQWEGIKQDFWGEYNDLGIGAGTRGTTRIPLSVNWGRNRINAM